MKAYLVTGYIQYEDGIQPVSGLQYGDSRDAVVAEMLWQLRDDDYVVSDVKDVTLHVLAYAALEGVAE